MQEILDPIGAFLGWYEQQDKEVQTDLAAFVLMASGTEKMPLTDAPETLKEWVLSGERGLPRLGRLSILRTVMEVCFAKPRSRPEYWARGAALSTVLGAKVRSEGHGDFADTLSSMVGSIPERQALWASACSSWRGLADSALSDASLELWLDSAMRPAAK